MAVRNYGVPVAQQLWSAAALPPLLYPSYVSLNPICVLYSQIPTDTPLLNGVRKWGAGQRCALYPDRFLPIPAPGRDLPYVSRSLGVCFAGVGNAPEGTPSTSG